MRSLLALALVATLALTTVADEKPKSKKKGDRAGRANPMVTNLMTGLKEAGLSEEQMTKIQTAATAFETKIKELREKGLTPELNKKRIEAAKAAREAGLKGKEMAAKVNESLSDEERAMLDEMQTAMVQMKKAVAGVLTEEQMKGLPEKVRKQLATRGVGKKPGKGAKGKGKKKEAA